MTTPQPRHTVPTYTSSVPFCKMMPRVQLNAAGWAPLSQPEEAYMRADTTQALCS